MAEDVVRYELRDAVALIRLDDGKANALGPQTIDALHAALDRAEGEASAVVLAGRPGRFSAGFDLKVLGQGGDAVGNLVGAGARLAFHLYELPLPTVIACTGHAIAMGAILLMSADTRIGVEGDFKIGLNEVAIGMALPGFALDFARERLSKRHLIRATVEAEMYSPASAVDAGFLDRTASAEALLDTACAEAARLAKLSSGAVRAVKRSMRTVLLEKMRAELDEEMKGFGGPVS